jgi:hypothetical protein
VRDPEGPDVRFHRVLAVELRQAGVGAVRADAAVDEVDAGVLRGVRDDPAVADLLVGARRVRRRHREGDLAARHRGGHGRGVVEIAGVERTTEGLERGGADGVTDEGADVEAVGAKVACDGVSLASRRTDDQDRLRHPDSSAGTVA